jgi:ADP-ribose pyrophosphatase
MAREVFERGHAVGLLLYDPDRDAVGLIEQFRPGAYAAGMHPWLIEVVAGIIEEGETAEMVATREAREEAGVTVDDLVPMLHCLMSPGGSSETMRLFCGRIDSTVFGGLHGIAEEHEDIRVFTLPAEEAFAWLTSGRINNATCILALQWLALNRPMLRDRWVRHSD